MAQGAGSERGCVIAVWFTAASRVYVAHKTHVFDLLGIWRPDPSGIKPGIVGLLNDVCCLFWACGQMCSAASTWPCGCACAVWSEEYKVYIKHHLVSDELSEIIQWSCRRRLPHCFSCRKTLFQNFPNLSFQMLFFMITARNLSQIWT